MKLKLLLVALSTVITTYSIVVHADDMDMQNYQPQPSMQQGAPQAIQGQPPAAPAKPETVIVDEGGSLKLAPKNQAYPVMIPTQPVQPVQPTSPPATDSQSVMPQGSPPQGMPQGMPQDGAQPPQGMSQDGSQPPQGMPQQGDSMPQDGSQPQNSMQQGMPAQAPAGY